MFSLEDELFKKLVETNSKYCSTIVDPKQVKIERRKIESIKNKLKCSKELIVNFFNITSILTKEATNISSFFGVLFSFLEIINTNVQLIYFNGDEFQQLINELKENQLVNDQTFLINKLQETVNSKQIKQEDCIDWIYGLILDTALNLNNINKINLKQINLVIKRFTILNQQICNFNKYYTIYLELYTKSKLIFGF